MKKILLILLFSFIGINAQNADKTLEDSVQKLFSACKSEDYKAAGNYMVYVGSNGERALKQQYNLKDRKEFRLVRRICNKIKALLNLSSNYKIASVKKEVIKGVETYVATFFFMNKKQKISQKMRFVKTGNNYKLAEIL